MEDGPEGKRGFERQDPTKINSISLIEAFNTSILSIWLLKRSVLMSNVYLVNLVPPHLIFYRFSRVSRP